MPIGSRFSLAPALVRGVIILLFAAQSLHAQLGSGWVQYTPTKKIHLDDEAGLQTFNWTSYKSVCSNSVCADYSYDSATDIETFRILDSRSNRSEIRLQNDYSTGRRQFEGYVTFYAPLENESLMQIFGSTSGATLTMTRGYASGGGIVAPYWVRLTRVGNSLVGYRSPDGVSWTQVGVAGVPMGKAVLVGLPVTAHDDATLNVAAFSNVSMPPPPRPRISAFNLSGSTLVISGTNGLPGGTYYLLASPAFDLPVSSWNRLLTNQFSLNGAFAITNSVSQSAPRQFYMLELQ